MSEPVLRLEPTRLGVDPGGTVTAELTVYNPGHRVEGYDLDVVAQRPMPWATVTPPTLSVYPQQEESAVVTFSPPSGASAPGGTLPFGVRARSQVDAALSTVVEGDLDVGTVAGLQATLTPVTSSGRWSGRHTVSVSNWGNSAARLRVTAQDPDQALGFLVHPPVLDVPLGRDVAARIKVRTRRPVLRGTTRRLPFQVVCEPEVPEELGAPRPTTATPERPVVDGAFNQKPILTRWVVIAGGLLLLGLVALVVWLLMRDDPAPDPEEAGVPAAPTGLRAVGNVSPSEVLLQWDPSEDVDGYAVSSVNPDLEGARGEALSVDDPEATTVAVALPPSTRMCFQIRAVRGDVESDFSPADPTEVCDETEPEDVEPSAPPGVPTPEETVAPDMEQAEGGGAPTGEGPTGGENGEGGENGGDADAPPQQFLTVLRSYSQDISDDAETEQQRLAALGVETKLLSTADYGLTAPGTPSPTGSPTPPPAGEQFVYLYLDGPSPADSLAACSQAVDTLTSAGETPPLNACAVTWEVTSRPGGEPAPTAAGAPSL
jgi:hypothetical protein